MTPKKGAPHDKHDTLKKGVFDIAAAGRLEAPGPEGKPIARATPVPGDVKAC